MVWGIVIRLCAEAIKIKQEPCSDWLPSRVGRAARNCPLWSHENKSLLIISNIQLSLPQAWSIKQTLTSSAQLLNSQLCMVPSLSLLLLISLISTAIKWNLTNLEACCCFGEMNFKIKTLCLSAEIKNPSVYCFVVIFRPSKLEYGERVFKYSSLYWKAVG